MVIYIWISRVSWGEIKPMKRKVTHTRANTKDMNKMIMGNIIDKIKETIYEQVIGDALELEEKEDISM